MSTLLLANSLSWLEPCALLSSALERHLGFQEKPAGAPSLVHMHIEGSCLTCSSYREEYKRNSIGQHPER